MFGEGPGHSDDVIVDANDSTVSIYYPMTEDEIELRDGDNLTKFRQKMVSAFRELDIEVVFTGDSWYLDDEDKDDLIKKDKKQQKESGDE